MPIEYEFTDADNNTPRRVEPGDYTAKVTGFEFGMSTTGKDKLSLHLQLSDVEVTIREDIYFTPTAQWKFDTVLKCFAPSKSKRVPKRGDRITVNDTFVEEFLQGGQGDVIIEDDEHNGVTKSRVKLFKAGAFLSEPTPGAGQANLLEEEEGKDVPF
jgi:hypothetical protein